TAGGFLLVCTTQPSSSLVGKLSELMEEPSNGLVTSYWDSVELEKRLNEPRGFALAHQFFPVSMKNAPWKVYNSDTPTRWAAHYKDKFLYLASRVSGYFPSLKDVEEILTRLEVIPISTGEGVRPRAVYFDDKHEQFTVFADYMVPDGTTPSLLPDAFEA